MTAKLRRTDEELREMSSPYQKTRDEIKRCTADRKKAQTQVDMRTDKLDRLYIRMEKIERHEIR